jgi:hypothetical protein
VNTNSGSQIPKVLIALDRLQCPHRILDPQSVEVVRCLEWIETRFPFIYTQIDWSKVTHHSCVSWQAVDDLVDSFGIMTKSMSLSSLVLVMWNDALCPAIELTLGDAVNVSREIFEVFEASLDNWIVCRHEGWLIEMHHEGTLCFGRVNAR